MTDLLHTQLHTTTQAVESRVGDETVLLHLQRGDYFGLDQVGTRIWELLKQGDTPATICDKLAEEYEMPRATVEGDLRQFLSELKAQDLVLEA